MNDPSRPQRLDPKRCALLVVDIQERLAGAMKRSVLEDAEANVGILVETAGRLGIPVVVSEQYPRGLGPTVAAIAEKTTSAHKIEKTAFSVCDAESFDAVWDEVRRDQWIVVGMECHVCVYQTARDLVLHKALVFVPADAVVSRKKANWKIGLRLMEKAGAVIGSTEVAVFDLLQRSGTEEFKALSKLIR